LDTANIVTYLLKWALVVYALKIILEVFYGRRKTSLTATVLSYLFMYCLSATMYVIVNIPIVNIVATFTGLVIVAINYEATFLRRATTIATCFALSMVADMAAATVVGHYHFSFLLPMNVGRLHYIGVALLTYIFALIVSRFKNISKDTVISPGSRYVMAAIPFITLFIAVAASFALSVQVALAATTAALFITNILAFYLHDTLSGAYENKLKTELYTQEKDFYFAQAQLMQESVKNIKSIRHDMNFHLAALKDMVGNKAAADYINVLLNDISENDPYSNTGNIAFDSIINYKLKTAGADNIKLDISIFVPPVTNIEITDIVTILGNLLDNALDATAKVEDKTIKLDVDFSKGNLYIKIDNSYDGNIKYAQGKHGEKEHIATLKAGDEHGYGLKNIRKAVEKYNGCMDISYGGYIFTVEILLYPFQ